MVRLFIALAWLGCAALAAAQTPARPNVLLIIADDLRPQLGCYGDTQVRSPRLDAFARTALRFDRAYVQCAICSPSRNSFLSGLRPGTTGLRGFGTPLREKVPEAITLPQHFKNHGYFAAGIGKVFHYYAETGLGSEDDPQSWSQPVIMPAKPFWGPEQEEVRLARVVEARAAGKTFNHSHDWPRAAIWDDPDVPDDELQEGEIAARAVALLHERAKTAERPFFLAVGFLKPHTPYVAPKRYWDLYDRAALRLPENQSPPQDAPPWAVPLGLGIGGFTNTPRGVAEDELKRTLLHAYLASISYMDASVGRVLAALDELGLAPNTVVVVLGDHGYQMGEHGSWNQKHCNFETATRAPLLVRAPGMAAAGHSTGALVEFVDLYPTLADCAGLDAPASLEGTSFRPLLAEPQRPWKTAAFSEMPRAGKLGRAIRTERHRYVEWTDAGGTVVARELYDHATDPNENQNLAGQAANGETVATLARQLSAGWQAAWPARSIPSPPPKS